jgi:hypothetical protein
MSRIYEQLRRTELERQAELERTQGLPESAEATAIDVLMTTALSLPAPAKATEQGDVVRLKQPKEAFIEGPASGVQVPGVLQRSELSSCIALSKDLYEQFLFESLVPAFDHVPLRRVFPFVLYTASDVADFVAPLIVRASGCGVVHNYPFLEGSGLSRALLQTRTRQTHIQREYGQAQVVEELVKRLRILDLKTVNIYTSLSPPPATNESTEGTSKLNELSEALKNTLLIAAGSAVLFGGTLIRSKESANPQKPGEISITQLDRETQLAVLPKILEADKAEDFLKIIESLHGKQQASAHRARPGSARKRRKK